MCIQHEHSNPNCPDCRTTAKILATIRPETDEFSDAYLEALAARRRMIKARASKETE